MIQIFLIISTQISYLTCFKIEILLFHVVLLIREGHSAGKPKFVSCKQRTSTNGRYDFKVKIHAMVRAEQVQSSLGTEFPSFLKVMSISQIKGYKLRFPFLFCRLHLIAKTNIMFKDDSGDIYEAKYCPKWMGLLTSGWKKFALQNKLHVGDVLLFCLVEPVKFKVHIVRANDMIEVDTNGCLPNLGAHPEQNKRGMLFFTTVFYPVYKAS